MINPSPGIGSGEEEARGFTPLDSATSPVQARRLPDGLLEVRSPGQDQPDIFILEIAGYPDARVPSPAVRDTVLVYLRRGIVPKVIVQRLSARPP